MRLLLAVVLLFVLVAPGHAGTLKPPCAGCTIVSPSTTDPVPLLVVLHGDRERATTAAARWQREVLRRGWAILSLQCPRSEGCVDSWWKWNGDPQWIRDQIAATAKLVAIDLDRVYAASWSGGATYLGMRVTAWSDVFAAIVIHGGGIAPADDTCSRTAPMYFLVGDRNPLHHLAVELQDFVRGCSGELVWDLVRRADHRGEARALTSRKARSILDWLSKTRLGGPDGAPARLE